MKSELAVKPIKNPDKTRQGFIGAKTTRLSPNRLSKPIVARAAAKGHSAMIQSACDHYETKKHGRDQLGNSRIRCCLCGKTWIDRSNRPLGDLRIDRQRTVMVLR